MSSFNYLTRDESALFFETNFSCDNAILLKLIDSVFFITDSRYTLEAMEYCIDVVVVVESKNLILDAIKILKKHEIKELVYDPLQINCFDYFNLAEQLPSLKLVKSANFAQKLRVIKTSEQISLIKKSQEINKNAYNLIASFVNGNLDSKLSEADLYRNVKCLLSDFCRYTLSFDPIVGLNATAAKPHAISSSQIFLYPKDSLLIDMGIKYERYCSDCTRTAFIKNDFSFNKIQKYQNKKYQKIYDSVLKAQESTISKIKAGMKAKDVDKLARDIIAKAGYNDYFIHSLGHGIGLDIHEEPFISPKSDSILEEGMVFSIEPGIYLPGEFGVRIEDLVVIKNGIAEIL